MHRLVYSIRALADTDLPTITALDGTSRPATDADLANLGLVRIGTQSAGVGLYSAAHQEQRDDVTLTWAPVGQVPLGTSITEGSLRDRHARLPAAVRDKVLQAQVISGTGAKSALTLITAALVARGISAPTPAALLAEAQRVLAALPPGQLGAIRRRRVAIADVDAGDLVEGQGMIPHSWHGESAR